MKKLMLLLTAGIFFFGCSGTQMVQPVLKDNIEPVYPYEAKVKGLEGIVDLLLSVNESGDVINTKVIKSSNHKILDDASIDYSKRLKFEPSSLEGAAVPLYIRWRLDYRLDGIDMENGKVNILVFYKSEGYKHESIEAGKISLKKIAEENNFQINFSEDSMVFEQDLSSYNVIVFLNTYGDILNEKQENLFKKFIQHKGGFVGIHSAAATEKDWKWYGELIGTYSTNTEIVKKGKVKIIEKNHPSTKYLPYTWELTDEWNIFSNPLPENIKILAVVEGADVSGNENMQLYPFCWYHEFEGGRCWYTSAGHNAANFSDPLFEKHILGGIKYAAGIE
jgi:uncharacterized protein